MSPFLYTGPSQHIILRNASDVTFGPAYVFGENNRRTVLENLGQDAGKAKARSLRFIDMGIAFTQPLPQRCGNSIPTPALMTSLSCGRHRTCILRVRRGL